MMNGFQYGGGGDGGDAAAADDDDDYMEFLHIYYDT
jgi:hypothetical protein